MTIPSLARSVGPLVCYWKSGALLAGSLLQRATQALQALFLLQQAGGISIGLFSLHNSRCANEGYIAAHLNSLAGCTTQARWAVC